MHYVNQKEYHPIFPHLWKNLWKVLKTQSYQQKSQGFPQASAFGKYSYSGHFLLFPVRDSCYVAIFNQADFLGFWRKKLTNPSTGHFFTPAFPCPTTKFLLIFHKLLLYEIPAPGNTVKV